MLCGTGFLYAHKTGKDPDSGQDRGYFLLMTNRHVLEGQEKIFIRLNAKGDEPPCEIEIPLLDSDGSELWMAHSDREIDVAWVEIEHERFEGAELQVFDKKVVAGKDAFQKDEIGEGNSVFTLGFPMGDVCIDRNFVIVRQGTIARIQDTLAGFNKTFLIDASIFPGNSGGPVVLRPEMMSIEGTQSCRSAWLLGVVTAYVPYTDVAVSRQTGHTRVVFQENSGLAHVAPFYAVQAELERLMPFETDLAAAQPADSADKDGGT